MTLLQKLAPYFPYELKFLNTKNKYETMFILSSDGVNVMNSHGYGYDFEEIKPILRPLSDAYSFYIDLDYHKKLFTYDSECDIWIEHSFKYLDNWEMNLRNIPFGLYQDMIKNHFDIFGMIESGEAIDINTLKNG